MRLDSLSTMFLLFILMPPVQADTITISKSVPFAEDSGATEKLKAECKFETRLPDYIKKYSKKKVDVVLSAEPLDDAQGKVLYLKTTRVFAPGGGGYSGSKQASVNGVLKENGDVIGSFDISRAAIFGMTPGTCSMMKRIAKKLGEEIVAWLVEPTMDAKLGDLAGT
jgi:hypothetical protein